MDHHNRYTYLSAPAPIPVTLSQISGRCRMRQSRGSPCTSKTPVWLAATLKLAMPAEGTSSRLSMQPSFHMGLLASGNNIPPAPVSAHRESRLHLRREPPMVQPNRAAEVAWKISHSTLLLAQSLAQDLLNLHAFGHSSTPKARAGNQDMYNSGG